MSAPCKNKGGMPLPLMMTPLGAILTNKITNMPKFDGRNFSDFSQRWLQYLRQLSGMQAVTEEKKPALARDCSG